MGEDVFVSCKEVKNEALSVGGLAGWEVVSGGVLGKGEELVVAVALAVSPCSAFCCFVGLGGDFLLAKTAMLWIVFVGGLMLDVRMCKGAQCLACRGGWRALVSISAVLVVEDTPPIRMLFST